MTYPIFNISDWKFIEKNVSGSKEKRWYQSSERKRNALFKLPISLTSDTWTILDESSGDTWSEKVCSEIGNVIGFCTHQVDIGALDLTPEVADFYGITNEKMTFHDVIYGSLCWSFLNNEEESLVEGADMIMDYDQTYDRSVLKGEREIYNFDLLYRMFGDYGMIDDLYKMIIFDTLIGNTDRHQDNFGVIRNEVTSHHTFSPLYDNSSSLGRELPVSRAELMLKDPRMFHSYIYGKNASTLIRWGSQWHKKGINLFEFYDLVKNEFPEIQMYTRQLEKLTDPIIYSLVSYVPSLIMSDTHKELVYKILITRRDRLLS